MKAVVLKHHGTVDDLEYVTDFPDPVVKRSEEHTSELQSH